MSTVHFIRLNNMRKSNFDQKLRCLKIADENPTKMRWKSDGDDKNAMKIIMSMRRNDTNTKTAILN